eukprot:9479260-Pyramimonas_sp.AAC.1
MADEPKSGTISSTQGPEMARESKRFPESPTRPRSSDIKEWQLASIACGADDASSMQQHRAWSTHGS